MGRQRLLPPRPLLARIVLGTITQLYPSIELYSDGEPPRHTLFVLHKGPAPPLGDGDRLLLVDPPEDARTRFSLPDHTAAIYTAAHAPRAAGVALVTGQSGGIAHVRVGDHLLDIYAQETGAVVFLPALGILCAGLYGSDALLPKVATGSDGQAELDTLRLLARLVRERNVQLYIPHQGALITDRVAVIERLADDVNYLHGLRRVIPALPARGEGLHAALALTDTLLPGARSSPACRAVHAANVQALFLTASHAHN